MTERLYYHDPYLTEFEATVRAVEEAADGRYAIRLDRTAFYPTSGGQPFDTGSLGDARVLGVEETEDGDVVHVVDRRLDEGGVISGRLDWTRRFDHMQQHTGQHILSAAFDHLLGARTESFHLGSETSTIDLSRELPADEITRAEDDANRVVWEDRAVGIQFVDASQAASLPLRKEPAREGLLRLIDVDGYDLSACGGTHVGRTGAVGIIAIAGWERFRGGSRIEFVCGVRALLAHRRLRDVSAAATRLLSVHTNELPAAVERLQGEAREARRRLKEAHAKAAVHEAAALADAAAGGAVVAALEGWDQNGLKLVASAVAARPGHVAALFSTPAPSAIVIARSEESPTDCAAALRQVIARFGGKGGGRPDLAQGGGLQGDPHEIREYLLGLLRPAAL
ncbi:MAG TPA: DHHA1 domain-containing protein [Vicinamibacterales bacterium]|nr:DHHA1 domain-containing protein [Vicinamibacterales bacterium]